MLLLQVQWRTAQRGACHMVCIQGEAGLGKTRLAEKKLRAPSAVNLLARGAKHCFAYERRHLHIKVVLEWVAFGELVGNCQW
ncbi:MAG: hypothetical protein WAU00_12370 [Caldilinea sp.]